MAKITNIEQSTDKNGNPMKVITFDVNQKVWINSKYEGELFNTVEVGQEHTLHKEGNFWKMGAVKAKGNIAQAQATKGEQIRSAQAHRDIGIKISSTARDATLIVTKFYDEDMAEDEIKNKWKEWRQWLYKNWDVDERDLEEPF